MIEHNAAGIRYFTYGLFEPYLNVTNVVTTRLGGRSGPPYDSLNLALHVGDDPDAVLENRAIVAQVLGFEPEAMTLAEQVHGSSVVVVRPADRGKGAVIEDDAVSDTDAMITDEADLPLAVLVADCVAVSLYDPGKIVIGVAHAGWKGTLGRVVEKTIEAMAAAYGTNPGDVLAGLGPSIGSCHYEVGREIAQAYGETFGEDAARFLLEDPRGSFRLDLRKANSHQLRRAGVSSDHIEVGGPCTACSPDLFYSHRRDGPRTGRIAGVISLRRGLPRMGP
jgi:YfiH family protein